MELSFLTSVVRRYYIVIIYGLVLGMLPAGLVGGADTGFESRAVLLVAPPTNAQLSFTVGGDPDRYVSGQLSVLRSQVMAERVAGSLGDGLTGRDVAAAVVIEREASTDVVTIVADTAFPDLSQAIANTYVEVYFASLRAQLEGTQEPVVAALDAQITELRAQLSEVDEQMVVAMRPYLDADPIPDIDQVAPGLISEKSILLTQYSELQATRNQLNTGLRVASEIVQEATLPTESTTSSRRTILAVGIVAGGFAGLLVAVVLARLSSKVLGDDQAEEILGYPVVGSLPFVRTLTANRSSVLDPLPSAAGGFVESLSVRAHALAQGRPHLTVVVVGTERAAGSTTLAASLARRFADGGSEVLLVDADRRTPELTDLFDIEGLAGPHLLPTTNGMLRLTNVNNLARTVGTRDATIVSELGARRADTEELVAAATKEAEIVIFDAGPLMESVLAVRLSWLSDVVVLAMPRRQDIHTLEVVATELRDRSVLPVWSPARQAPRRQLPRPTVIRQRRTQDTTTDDPVTVG